MKAFDTVPHSSFQIALMEQYQLSALTYTTLIPTRLDKSELKSYIGSSTFGVELSKGPLEFDMSRIPL